MMIGRGSSNHRLSSASNFRSLFSLLMLSMFSTMAWLYVAGRLWQDAENRVNLVKELDMRTGQGHASVSVDDTLKIIDCREQQKRLSDLQVELEKARQEGFVSKKNSEIHVKKKLLGVIGVITRFGRRNNRDAIRKAWMPTGSALRKLEDEKGLIMRFVIGMSPSRGDKLDREIDEENSQTGDFLILNDHTEAPEEQAKKTKFFLAHAAEHWDAEFYVKVNDDIFVNVDALGSVLANHLDKSRAYIGCMKSGEVFSQPSNTWYEPEWWKFGEAKSYFRHASGEMFAISQTLAQFISINRLILHTYAHDDVSVGSWFVGLDVKHVAEAKFCCSLWSSGSICSSS